MVEYAGALVTLFNRGQDGAIAFHRLPWRVAVFCFGERIEARQRTQNKVEGRWRPGLFLGVRRMTIEKIVADAGGAYLVQSVRLLEGSRWGPGFVKGIRSTPWSPRSAGEAGEGVGDLPQPIAIRPEVPEQPAGRPQEVSREPVFVACI